MNENMGRSKKSPNYPTIKNFYYMKRRNLFMFIRLQIQEEPIKSNKMSFLNQELTLRTTKPIILRKSIKRNVFNQMI